ncbi:hypothetical protein QTH90_06025 [Variovorax sp. J2P1-59]|uniref:hypothetical protein n=1 Tax=Variovorax flavidus TaxID=3053501 RepID=UPI0025789A0E|nr:hypothetical protein [Variovorax sp. J2P1-59]MDM0073930.1 hypothetical protein [Variovorax sp. J2P1-59]
MHNHGTSIGAVFLTFVLTACGGGGDSAPLVMGAAADPNGTGGTGGPATVSQTFERPSPAAGNAMSMKSTD